MRYNTTSMKKIKILYSWLRKDKKRIVGAVILLVLLIFAAAKLFGRKSGQIQYQTAQAEKGTLVVSISASGQVSSANNTSVTTQASGVVTKVYAKNDQAVKTGDKIAELELDLEGQLRATQAFAGYQSAKNNYYSLQSALFNKWKIYMDMAQSSTYQNADGSPKTDQRQLPQFFSVYDDWLAAEANYNIQQINVSSAWLNYQRSSPTIYAPISGTITGLSLQEGTVLLAQSNSSGTATSQKIASVKTNAAAQLVVNITEMDVTKIKIGNKVSATLDALPGKTYTGKVISIDTIGAVSSGVTSYPAVIGLDTEVPEIFPNMAVNVKIITKVVDDVVLIPSAAVQTSNEQSTVRVMKDKQITQVPVEIGEANDTQIVITSGLNEGDVVVTNVIGNSSRTTQNQGTASPFGGFGGGARGISR